MQIKCEYCGNYFDDSLEHCEHCGATNRHFRRIANEIPKTINELKKYCEDKKFPLEKLHFHIGENYKGAKAFGIYKDENTGKFIVYKNKSNGERAIRYEGFDEAYAVNEIYMKLKEQSIEFKSQYNKNKYSKKNNYYNKKEKPNTLIKTFIKVFLSIIGVNFLVSLFTMLIFAIIWLSPSKPYTGYYKYNDKVYYNQRNDWYVYDNDSWIEYNDSNFDDDFLDNYSTYYSGSNYYDNYNASDFSLTDYYEEPSYSYDNDDDWDSDWDDDWDDYDYDYDYDYDWDSDW